MKHSEDALKASIQSLSDPELQRRASSGGLPAEAQAIAEAELAYRRKVQGFDPKAAGRPTSGWYIIIKIWLWAAAAVAIVRFARAVMEGKVQL